MPMTSMTTSKPNRADLLLASIPLVERGSDGLVIGACSAALVRYRERRVILTVAHSTANEGNWGVVERCEPATGQTRLYQLGAFTYVWKGTIGESSLRPVDVAFVRVPDSLSPIFQRINARTFAVEEEVARYELSTELDLEPRKGTLYGFAGAAEVDMAMRSVFGDIRTEDSLTLSGSDDDWYYFDLNRPHPGDKYYKGCSGAPILDADLGLVALVAGRRDGTDEIRALRLSRFRSVLDAEFFET
jgi:hypothetical protein